MRVLYAKFQKFLHLLYGFVNRYTILQLPRWPFSPAKASLFNRRLVLNLALLFLLLVLIVTSIYVVPPRQHLNTTLPTRHFSSTSISHLQTGATHEHYDADPWNNPTAVVSAKQLMQTSLNYQNQQMMGWGAGDPEPSPGVYNWQSLDTRVQLMRDTNANMVLTLCAAPGWMRPSGYQDDWKYIEIAPDPTHVQDFANLAKAVAMRYPDVKYFQVWNELKGMWSTSPGATPAMSKLNRWDYARYTTLYNAVYDAIKSVRPDAQIGGPYVVMDSDGNKSAMSNPGPSYSWGTLDQRPLDVITYWLAHKHGADFITVDGSSSNTDGVWLTDEFATAQKFVDVYNWIRTQPNGGATLPLWWAEWYAGYPSNAPKDLQYYNALMASAEIYTLRSGAAVALIWQPQGDRNGFSFPEGIWTDTGSVGGGQATPYYATAKAFKDYFGSGTQLYQTSISGPNLTVLASSTKVMLVNHLSIQQKVVVNASTVILNPYQVTVINAQ